MFRYDKVQATIEIIVREFNPEKIIIFGSVAKGTADEHSDLNILVVLDTDESHYRRPSRIYKAVSRVRIPKDIFVLTPEEFQRGKEKRLSFMHEIVRTGKVVHQGNR